MLNVGNAEIIQIADSVSKEKGIPRDVILHAMEQAIQVAGRKKYGQEHQIKAEINQNTGEVRLFRLLEIVESVEDNFTQISLKDAQEKDPEAQIGDFIHEPLPPIDLGRVAAQTAKQVIIQKVRDAERDKQYADFKNRVGEILNGTVKRIEFGNIIVDLGRTEAIIKRDQVIPNETFRINDRIKSYVEDVRRENKGPQIFLSRAHNEFLSKLFELEVPEVYDHVIEIKAVARDPGSKAKVAVYTKDNTLDPVGSCVGVRGSRVRNITNELAGEKIDVIEWTNDLSKLAISALAPAEVAKVIIDEENHKIEAIVAPDQLSAAIGRRGQNVRLASKLIGWNLDVITEDEASKRRSEEFNSNTELFMHALDVEEVIAQLLTVEGYHTVNEIANADIDDLAKIEGFDADVATELQSRAINYVNERNNIFLTQLENLGVEQELLDVLEINLEDLVRLAEYGVKTIEDLGEMTLAEFRKIIPESVMEDEAILALIAAAKEIEDNKEEVKNN